ncbi:putative polyketide synthase protein [Naviculisporaceae sp. PSN 640]
MAPSATAAPDQAKVHISYTPDVSNNYPGDDTPIAIIGMSCRLPGDATSPERLWKLCAEGRSAWSEIPSDRFNKEAFYHPSSDKRTTTHVRGGHFLQEDIGLFDATFFNMTPEVAATMDPQCRLQLESVYEAFESAGITLEKIAGSETAVYAGAFFKDYMDSLMRDPDTFPRYVMTGNGATMMSNRISHFYDLRGPSMTVDTGCSTGLVALHQACRNLVAGDSKMAIVGGANVMINPDIFILMSSLGFLSPDGKSYAFDSRAAGYGRGEGVATVILKPLHDAVRDGDPVRAVIRASALNQDGKTQTITSPNQTAQEELIKLCYAKAGLNPAETAYVEAHGTGTQAGDPVEAGAIHAVMCKGRPSDAPLYIGSVKTNVGHMETASGFASIIKVALALEKGLIPPSLNFEEANAKIPLEQWKLRVPRKLEQWPAGISRRASINNFGYGGANAHVIIEAWEPATTTPYPVGQSSLSVSDATLLQAGLESQSVSSDSESEDNMSTTTSVNELILPGGLEDGRAPGSRVLLLSAKDEIVVRTMAQNLKEYVATQNLEGGTAREGKLLDQIAYTLSERRSRFPWKLAVRARGVDDIATAFDTTAVAKLAPTRSTDSPRLGFVFTGQGAQWYAMGRELIGVYPVFTDTLREADQHLRDMGCTWSLLEELTKSKEESRINDVVISPPLCIAMQIALVRLLASWGVVPTGITSHSSGEVAAAYAAGVLTLREAMAIVYARGGYLDALRTKAHNRGAMMAVGLGREEAEAYLARIPDTKAVVACVNSPTSVTISGDQTAIMELEEKLVEAKVFARILKVPVAYHSHHMNPVADDYLVALRGALKHQRSFHDNVLYTSPVTGGVITDSSEIGPEHWVKNMLQPVEFVDALANMCLSPAGDKQIDMLVEIGPHGALAGPIRQCLQLPQLASLGIGYGTCLVRGDNAVDTMHTLAASLASSGYPIDLHAVNFPRGGKKLTTLTDLPTYPWNHRTRHWCESRMNKAHRLRQVPTHDLLGNLLLGSNSLNPTWRHIIRPSEVPWVRDHTVQSDIVYPGAGLISMAVEAMRQYTKMDGKSTAVTAFALHDVDIKAALVIPDTAEGTEVQLCLRRGNGKTLGLGDCHEFSICSTTGEGSWTEHCRGLISASTSRQDNSGSLEVASQDYTTKVNPDDIFSFFKSVGIYHGPTFQNLQDIQYAPGRSLTKFVVADTAATMPGNYQQEAVVHPTTLDSVFQAAYSALEGGGTRLGSAMVPRSIKRMFISADISRSAGDLLHAYSSLQQGDDTGFHASVAVKNCTNSTVLEIEDIFCQSLGGSSPSSQNTQDTVGNKCLTIQWEEDLSLTSLTTLTEKLKAQPDPAEVTIVQDMKRACFHFFHDAISQLTPSDVENLLWYHKIFHSWMKLQIDLEANADNWLTASSVEREELFSSVAKSSVDGEMVVRIGRNLVPILRQQTAPLELMLQDQLLYRYYKDALRIDRSYGQVHHLVNLFAHKNPRAKVLEIGAGTGGCTQSVLDAFGGGDTDRELRLSHYDFTDISSGFFEQARNRFSAWGDVMQYRKLDVESDPSEQGFEPGSYDLIVACQVLHATKNMERTMANVRKLLKPGGKLIMVETTHDVHDIQLIFGVLPGWWLSEEAERKHSPSLSLGMWERVLRSTGFSGLEVQVRDCEDAERYVMSVLMSTALPSPALEEQEQPEMLVTYVGEQPPPRVWLEQLREGIKSSTGKYPSIDRLGASEASPEGKICIFIDRPDKSALVAPTEAMFLALQQLTTRAKGVLWVSYGGAVECSNPLAALPTGFLRTLRLEDTSKRYISLDFDASNGANHYSATTADAIVQVLSTAFDPSRAPNTIDFEYAMRGSSVLIPRVYEDKAATHALASTDETTDTDLEPFNQPHRELRLTVQAPGMLDSLIFIDNPDASVPLPDSFVEIETKAFGLNFRDVMVAMNQLQSRTMGFECAGIITKLGANIPLSSGLKVGDRVSALLRGHWANHARVHHTSVVKIPDSLSWEIAASIPVVFVTAYYALYTLAKLQKGETVLIHSAAGGVGQAAIQLAQLRGAEVFATVGSDEKRAFLEKEYAIPADHIFSSRDNSFARKVQHLTSQKGVDVVLNSLAGELLHATWTCLAPFGRFVEIGKRDFEENNSLQMGGFTKSTSFFAVDLIMLGDLRTEVVKEVFADVMGLFEAGRLRPVGPITTYGIGEVEKAFRVMQMGRHTGKIVLLPGEGEGDLVKVRRREVRLVSEEEAAGKSYLVVGGAGGLGRSITRMLVELGASNIVLLSRSATEAKNAEFVDELRALGVSVEARNVDIADAKSLNEALGSVRKTMPPIRGVIQGAMVLQDSIVENMTHADYLTATLPKVQGTWNLHQQFPNPSDLDFFVMLSSLTGVVGNSSQANYAAGGTFQDALGRYRSSLGLPGSLSIDLGMVSSVGYVAENEGVAERLARQGYKLVQQDEVLALIKNSICSSSKGSVGSGTSAGAGQVLIGLSTDLDEAARSEASWGGDVRFTGLKQKASDTNSGNNQGAGKMSALDLANQIRSADSWDQAVDSVCDAIVNKLSVMFALPEEEMDKSQSMAHYGIDSLVAVELRNWLSSAAQTEVSIFDIMQSKSLVGLAGAACVKSRLVDAGLKPKE